MPPKQAGFYAVRVGRCPGVYTTWEEASRQVMGYPHAVHKKFPTKAEAIVFAFPDQSSHDTAESRPAAQTPNDARSGYAVATPVNRTSTENSKTSTMPSSLPLNVRSGYAVVLPATNRTPTSTSSNTARGSLSSQGGRVVYCDGSCLSNGQQGSVAGIGAYWGNDPNQRALNLSERLPGPIQTNNRAEIYALARALEVDPHPELPLIVATDSQYTISIFQDWIPKWIASSWRTSDDKPVQNKDLIQYVLALIKARPSSPYSYRSPTANVSFVKVKAHVGIHGNEMADQLAKWGASLPCEPERNYAGLTRNLEQRIEAMGRHHQALQFKVDVQHSDLWTSEELEEMARTGVFP